MSVASENQCSVFRSTVNSRALILVEEPSDEPFAAILFKSSYVAHLGDFQQDPPNAQLDRDQAEAGNHSAVVFRNEVVPKSHLRMVINEFSDKNAHASVLPKDFTYDFKVFLNVLFSLQMLEGEVVIGQ